ncbi:DUF485 domain-containing protein [Streptomyces sp. NPDC059894]|uniref:DUF485 domain-containing protein n=1 Tax=unclassified Streptomyces TaxID=2593676 RepID=UPI003650441B
MVWRAAPTGRYTEAGRRSAGPPYTAFRGPRRTAAVLTGGMFLAFLLLSACAPRPMSRPVTGDGPPVGMLVGLVQLPFTAGVLWWFERAARRGADAPPAPADDAGHGGEPR